MKNNNLNTLKLTLLATLGIIAIFFLGNYLIYGSIPFINNSNFQQPEPITVAEGQKEITLKRGQTAILLSGSSIYLQGDNPWFYFDRKSVPLDYLPISSTLTVQDKGYTYEIRNIGCNTKQELDYDIVITKTIDCTLSISTKHETREVSSYSGIQKTFSSLNDQRGPRKGIVVNEKNPFLVVEVPYTQIYRDGVSKEFTFTSPIGNTVTIFTHYGKVEFKYDISDLFDMTTQTATVGPLTVTFTISDLGCYLPYTCDYSFAARNRVDYVLSFQEIQNGLEAKIIDYQIE